MTATTDTCGNHLLKPARKTDGQVELKRSEVFTLIYDHLHSLHGIADEVLGDGEARPAKAQEVRQACREIRTLASRTITLAESLLDMSETSPASPEATP